MKQSDWTPALVSHDREIIDDRLGSELLKVTDAGEYYMERWEPTELEHAISEGQEVETVATFSDPSEAKHPNKDNRGSRRRCTMRWLTPPEAWAYYVECLRSRATTSMMQAGGGVWLTTEEHGHPEAGQTVLLANSNNEVEAGYHDGIDFLLQINDSTASNITHWRFLPPPPTKD